MYKECVNSVCRADHWPLSMPLCERLNITWALECLILILPEEFFIIASFTLSCQDACIHVAPATHQQCNSVNPADVCNTHAVHHTSAIV